MRKTSLAAAVALALCCRYGSPGTYVVKNRNISTNPLIGHIPKQKAQFGKPPKKLHNRGIGNGQGRKNR